MSQGSVPHVPARRAIYTHVDKDFSGTVDFLEFLQASFPNISKEDIIYAVEVYSKFEVWPLQLDAALRLQQTSRARCRTGPTR